MAEHLLGTIALAQDYEPTSTIDDAVPSDLQNAVVTGATVNIQLSNQLNITSTTTPFPVDLPMGVTIDFTYGTIFHIEVDIDVTTAGETRRSCQIQLLNSSDVVIASGAITLLSAGANSISADIDSMGLEWNQVRLRNTRKGGTGPTFEFSNVVITNDAFTVFNDGDNIIVYWDDVADDFIVQREDNPGGSLTTITSGPNLGPLEEEQFTDGGFYKFCDGTTLVSFGFTFNSPDFPYFTKQFSFGNALCAVTPVACNCFFSGTAVITGATNGYSSDGSVQLSATPTLSAAVKFTTFNPANDIRGQYVNATNTSGLFSNLKAGTYKFYAVDSYSCFSEIDVVIPATSESSYNPKYRLQYYDVETNTQSVIDIQERAYAGDPIYIQGDGDPFKLSKETGELNNKFDTIRGTFAELTLNSENHFQFISLFSQDDKKYRISYTHGTTSWKGYIVPSVYRELYSPSKNYPITLTAADGLGTLNDYDFVDSSGNVISGLMSLRQIILECVNKIGLQINLIIGVNKYASGMSATTSDDPLGQTYVDTDTFIEDGVVIKCSEVLDRILKPFGAFITQKDSKWHVLESESQVSAYYYREYTYANAFVTSGLINPIINIDRPYVNLENVLFTGSSHSLEIIPAYGKISVISKLIPSDSIFPASLDEWTPNTALGGAYDVKDDPDDPVNKMLSISVSDGSFKLISPEFDVKTISDAVELSLKVKYSWASYAPIDINGLSIGYNTLNAPRPHYMPIGWMLRFTVNSVDYYFNEGLGWNRSASIGTSTTSVTIPTILPSAKTFTTQAGLSLGAGSIIKVLNSVANYFRAVVVTYNDSTGVVDCDAFAFIGSGTYTSWTIYRAGPEYNINRTYVTQYDEYVEFNKKIDLPVQSYIFTPTSTIQLILVFYGNAYTDYTNDATLKAIPSAVYPVGWRVRPQYTLTAGTDAESSPDVLRPNDFHATTNAVVWKLDSDRPGTNGALQQLMGVSLKDVFVKYLPNKQNPTENQIISYVNNPNFRELLEYELDICDIPTELAPGHEAYKNILRLSDGSPTSGWARRGIDESNSIQELLVKSLGNQYSNPSWRLSGDWLGPDITTTSIIKHTITNSAFEITNPDLPGGTGWEQAGAGTTWTDGGTYYQVVFTGAGNSLVIRQNATLVAGVRIKVDFNLIRLSSSGTRVDRLVGVLYSGSGIIQTVILLDKIETDTDSTATYTFYVENTSDKIGFYIENMTGTGSATYRINTFDANGLPSVRYYYLNRVDRQDRHNLYKAELVQLTPVLRSELVDDVNGSGGFAGDSWSSGFSTGFGAGFNEGVLWG